MTPHATEPNSRRLPELGGDSQHPERSFCLQLLSRGLVSPTELEDWLDRWYAQEGSRRQPFGQFLFRHGRLTSAQLVELLGQASSQEIDGRGVVWRDGRLHATEVSPGIASEAATIGRYQILDKLGEGGFGVVFRAVDPKLDRTVALKLLKGSLTAADKDRFNREAKILGRLDHPAILPLFEIGEHENQPFLVMPLASGRTLRRQIDLAGPMVPHEAAELIRQVAEAIAYVHEQKVFHRDLKPANVMVSSKGEAVVMDFGIARLEGSTTLTESGARIGTPMFFSPEQAAGKPIGAETDIWGLGILLYYALTGQAPHRADSREHLLALIQCRPVPSPRLHRPEIAEALEVICLRCLELRPEDRYPDAGAVATALVCFLEGQSIADYRREWRFWLRNLWRTHRRKLTVAATLLLVATGIGLWRWQHQHQARAQRRELQRQAEAEELRQVDDLRRELRKEQQALIAQASRRLLQGRKLLERGRLEQAAEQGRAVRLELAGLASRRQRRLAVLGPEKLRTPAAQQAYSLLIRELLGEQAPENQRVESRALLLLADVALERARYEQAAKLAAQAVAQGAEAWRAAPHQTRLLIRQGKVEEAYTLVTRARQEAPEDPELLRTKGHLELVRGKYGQAFADQQLLVKRRPENLLYWLDWAEAALAANALWAYVPLCSVAYRLENRESGLRSVHLLWRFRFLMFGLHLRYLPQSWNLSHSYTKQGIRFLTGHPDGSVVITFVVQSGKAMNIKALEQATAERLASLAKRGFRVRSKKRRAGFRMWALERLDQVRVRAEVRLVARPKMAWTSTYFWVATPPRTPRQLQLVKKHLALRVPQLPRSARAQLAADRARRAGRAANHREAFERWCEYLAWSKTVRGLPEIEQCVAWLVDDSIRRGALDSLDWLLRSRRSDHVIPSGLSPQFLEKMRRKIAARREQEETRE